jgi:hypothetical protein
MLYITLLDQFHPGIYSSQVIDVCDYLNEKYNAKVRIVAFLSIKELRNTDAKKRLMELSPSAIVLPAFPKLRYFQWTALFLFIVCLFTGERILICRNIFCATMALRLKRTGIVKKVILDGRSAMAAEIEEYNVFPVDYLKKNVKAFESFAVNNSDFRMAVSNQLVNYWKTNYGYRGNEHLVIPCTLDRKYFNESRLPSPLEIEKMKNELGFSPENIVMVYAGSTAPWQSFELFEKMFTPLLNSDERIRILFLSKETADNKRMCEQFPGRVVVKWVEHKDVLLHLSCCSYGILVREQSDTNKVASPTKFAEYLFAGLKVLISENLGDFSEFVKKHNCGFVLTENSDSWPRLNGINAEERERLRSLSINNFYKESPGVNGSYSSLIQHLSI